MLCYKANPETHLSSFVVAWIMLYWFQTQWRSVQNVVVMAVPVFILLVIQKDFQSIVILKDVNMSVS